MKNNNPRNEKKEEFSPDSNDRDDQSLNEQNWKFCPICGFKFTQIKSLEYCMKCGVNLEHLKQQKLNLTRNYQYSGQQGERYHYLPQMVPPRSSRIVKVSDNDILNTKDRKLWGTLTSIGIPLLSMLMMYFITIVIVIIIILFTLDIDLVYSLLSDPFIFILLTLTELILILLPLIVTGKYLENPNFKNRLAIMGLTVKSFSWKKLLKEILIGLGFAIIGVILVFLVSLMLEILVELMFGIEIIQDITGSGEDLEGLYANMDIFTLILLVITMFLVIGTTEEILFRGFMQKGLVRTTGKIWGILITAIVFSLIHIITIFLLAENLAGILVSFILNFFPYLTISLLLGLVYFWRKENLIAVIITHGAYDSILIILGFLFYYLT